MRVKIKLFATLRERVGLSEMTVEFNGGIVELLEAADREADGKLKLEVWDEEKNWFKDGILVFVNGRNIEFAGGKNAKFKDGDVIDIFPMGIGG